MALMLTIHYANRLDFAVAGGWFGKAERLLVDQPESFAHGHLAVVTALFKEAAGDWPSVLERARDAYEIGRRCDDPDLQALGLALQGLALTHLGEVAEGTRLLDEAMAGAVAGEVADGTRLLDEAMAGAVAGELTTMPTGIVYCRMLCACLDLQDFGRAGDWTGVIDRCADRPGLQGLPGDCRTYRAEVLLKRGAWTEGIQEAARAVEETATLDLPHAGIASRELGEIRLRQGDFDAAEQALLRAHQYGASPEPGMSLLRLARGQVASAAAGLQTALASLAGGRLTRARLLPARVEVSLVAGDLDAAQEAVGELEETAETYCTPALAAVADHARGALELTVGNAADAERRLEAAIRLWQHVNAPYDAARARVLLGEAYLAGGDRDSCLMELQAASAAFERLGARPDIASTERRIAELTD
jgi:tetratricopeptide (TPR) repeat protein